MGYMSDSIRGPEPKTHCHRGHEMTPENTRQLYMANGRKNGRRCLKCSADRIARYRELHPELAKKIRTDSAIRMKFGIDGISGREQLLASQGGACALCKCTDCTWGKGFKKKWHIDHDHKTGEVRSILCSDCNTLLGKVESDPTLIDKMLAYLKR